MADVVKSIGSSGRDYSSITLWEADLDNGAVYAAGDIAIGECYDDSAFSENPTLDGGTTIGLGGIRLTVATGHRHNGTPGTGVRLVKSAAGSFSSNYASNTLLTSGLIIEWLEINGNDLGHGGSSTGLVGCIGTLQQNRRILRNLLIHNTISSSIGRGVWLSRGTLLNSFVFNITANGTNAVYGAHNSNTPMIVRNCTFHNLYANSGGNGSVIGVFNGDTQTTTETRNTIVGTLTPAGTGTATGFSLSANSTFNYNLSADATASGTGSLTNRAASNQFVSTVLGSEDLHLKAGADAIDAGVDLGTTDGGHIDIDGRDRDANGDTWDIGAHEYVASGGSPANLDAGNTILTLTVPTATTLGRAIVTPGTVAANVSVPTAALSAGVVGLSATTTTFSLTVPNSAVTSRVTLAADTVSVAVDVPVANVVPVVLLNANEQLASLTIPDATVVGTIALGVDTQPLTLTVPTASIHATRQVAVLTTPVTTTAPNALVTTSGQLQAAQLTITVPTATVTARAAVSADSVGTSVVVPTAGTTVVRILTPNTVNVSTTVPEANTNAQVSIVATSTETPVTVPAATVSVSPVQYAVDTANVSVVVPVASLVATTRLNAASTPVDITVPTATVGQTLYVATTSTSFVVPSVTLVSGAVVLQPGTMTLPITAATATIRNQVQSRLVETVPLTLRVPTARLVTMSRSTWAIAAHNTWIVPREPDTWYVT